MIHDYEGPNAPEPIQHEPGIYFGLPLEPYMADPALGSSSLVKLNTSPITYWRDSHMNPDRKVFATEDTEHGTMAHCRLLEGPEVFASRYVAKLDEADYPDVPKSGKELEAECVKHGLPKSGTIAEKEARLKVGVAGFVPWSLVETEYARRNAGRKFVKAADLKQIEDTAAIVKAHSDAGAALSGGYPEVSIFWEDPETGIRCKARIDRLQTKVAVDLKTFSVKGSSIDRAIASSFARYGYATQAVHYSQGIEIVKALARTDDLPWVEGAYEEAFFDAMIAQQAHRFLFVFVESCAYPAIRVREFARFQSGTTEETLYWKSGAASVRRALATYDACMKAYGPNKPWVDADAMTPFTDEDLFYA